ncbi:MAG: translocation/assembly module TamB domain-containing protein [Bacteroidetes bacterium]|nr:translocation/assembly module TamB domain-containing protein [Bacteroidota bacterium]
MLGRLLRHVSRRTMHAIGLTVLFLFLAFFAATRTQIGRDQLSRQIERAFNNTYKGELRIGRLTGNLLNTLYARDISLTDPDGLTIATIDSVVVEPRWSDLLRYEFSVRSISIHRPILNINLQEDGGWNLARALERQTEDSSSTGSAWTFRSAMLTLHDGVLISTNAGSLPVLVSSGDVFDFTNAKIDGIDFEARIDWESETPQIDILGFSGELIDSGFRIVGGRSQFLVEDDRISINELEIGIGESSLLMSGFIDRLRTDSTKSWLDMPFLINLEPTPLSFDELKFLFPNLPLSGSATLSAHVQGPISDLTVSWLRIRGENSELELAGTLHGLPDYISYQISVAAARLDPEEMRAWLPGVSFLKSLQFDSLGVEGYADGVVQLRTQPPTIRLAGNVDIVSDHGDLSTEFELAGPIGDSLSFVLGLTADNLNLAFWTGKSDLTSHITGSIRTVGRGVDPRRLTAEAQAWLYDLRIGPSRIASLTMSGRTSAGIFSSDFEAVLAEGSLILKAEGAFGDGTPSYSLKLNADGADIGPLLGNDSLRTWLNLQASLLGSGLTDDRLSAEFELQFDSSQVILGRRVSVIEPHSIELIVRDAASDLPRISLMGDVAEIDVSGDMNFSVLSALASAWGQAIRMAVLRESDKSLYTSDQMDTGLEEFRETVLWETARVLLTDEGFTEPVKLHASGNVFGLHFVSNYWPTLPYFDSVGWIDVALQLDDELLRLNAQIEADSIRFGTARLAGTIVTGNFEAAREPSIEQSVRASLRIRSDSMSIGGQRIMKPEFAFDFADRSGILSFASPGTGRVDSVNVRASISLLENGNQITIDRLDVQACAAEWRLDGQPRIDVFKDAIVVNDAVLRQHRYEAPTGQQIRAYGTLSDQAVDTLHFAADAIVLHEMWNYLTFSPHLGGFLDAKLAITGGGDRPSVAGEINVEQFSLDERILGNLSLSSNFIPGSTDVNVRLLLTPADTSAEKVIFGTDEPAAMVDNDLVISGMLRLPGVRPDGTQDPGEYRLGVDVRRVDMFFIEYIFSDTDNVIGYADGGGTISGSFSEPIFDIDLEIHEGRLAIPAFNLDFSLTGEVQIAEEAIIIKRASLRDITGGTAEITGNLFFNDYRFFTLDLNGELQDFQIMNVASSDDLPFYGFIWTSGSLTLDGPLYGASLRSANATTSANSELFIPVEETAAGTDDTFIVFSDSIGHIPDFRQLASRPFLLAKRPDAERRFIDALDMDLSILVPQGSTIHLVIDPLLGDVINAVSAGRVQLQRTQGEFFLYGALDVSGGDYLFTAGEVFVRRFSIDEGGTITWNGDPINATLDIPASYRTRASRAGLGGTSSDARGLIPLIVSLNISGTVQSPAVDLGLSIDRSNQNVLGDYQALEAQLNQPDRATEYATSVLLVNSFQLTTDNISTDSGGQLAFNSVSQLVSSQVNRFLNEALPNVDFSFGLQGENAQDLDVTYAVALRLLDERLIIRGEGVYQSSRSGADDVSTSPEGLQGEFVVEVRLSPTVSVEVFFRREGDILESTDLTNTAGAGLSYQTEFPTWRILWNKLFGWLTPDEKETEPPGRDKTSTDNR